MISHASHLYDDLTVRENVRFAVRAAGGDAARIDPALERWGLVGRLAKTQAGRLSAGQRRRVALAGLTARWPELWLLDEPHAGLDASARTLLDDAVTEAAASGVTVLIASHEPGPVEQLAGRAVTVTGGRVTGERVLGGRAAPTAPPPLLPSDAAPVAPPSDAAGEPTPRAAPDPTPDGSDDGRYAPAAAGRPAPTGPVAHVA